MKKPTQIIATLGISILSTPLTVSAAETHIIRFSNWMPPAHYIIKEMIEPWAKQVHEVTEGRVKIEFINPLGRPQAHFDLVRNGVADMAVSVHSYTASRFPLVEFSELPFTTSDGGLNSKAYWETYQQYMNNANEHRGVKLLGAWTSPASVIFVSKDISSLNDLKGLKLRSPSPLFDNVGKALGSTTVNAPAPETYEMLSRGVIDGVFFQYDQLDNFKLDKLIKTAVSVPGGFGKTSQYLFINEKKWEAINTKDRKAIESISGLAIAEVFGKKWQKSEDNAIKKYTEAGLKTYRIQGDELNLIKSELSFLEKNWLKTARSKKVDAEAALNFFKNRIEELQK